MIRGVLSFANKKCWCRWFR